MRRTKVLVVLTTFVQLIAAAICNADYLDYHFRLECYPSSNLAEIVPFSVYNLEVYSSDYQECRFANGRTVRVKMGRGPTYPYGMGGGIPKTWVSVWVDKAKVLSHKSFGCEYEGDCGLRITVTSGGLTICWQEAQANNAASGQEAKRSETCETIPNSRLSKVRDRLEYPLGKDPVPPEAGKIMTLFAKDQQLCNSFQKLTEPRGDHGDMGWYVIPPRDAISVKAEKTSSYEFVGHYEYLDFDINNDGKVKHVVALYSRTHYRDGDVYFVFGADSPPPIQVEDLGESKSELYYASKAQSILPHYWNTPGIDAVDIFGDRGTDDGYYSFKSAKAPWWNPSDKPEFRFRYWYLWPFRLKNQTYFLTGSREADKYHWYGVLMPKPNGSVTEICLFQRVKERY